MINEIDSSMLKIGQKYMYNGPVLFGNNTKFKGVVKLEKIDKDFYLFTVISIDDMNTSSNKIRVGSRFVIGYDKLNNLSDLGMNENTNRSDIYERLYRWIELFGGKRLLTQKNISNGTWLKHALESGEITEDEIDNATADSAASLKFSELPLYKKVKNNVSEDHKQFGGIEPYDAISIAAQYTDENLEPVANQIVKTPEELYLMIIDYIPAKFKNEYKKEFANAYKINAAMLKETDMINEAKRKKSSKKSQKLKGGKGDNVTADSVNPYELRKGINIEMEHTDDIAVAIEIAIDHLTEDPMYYSNLIAFETNTKKKNRADIPTEIPKKKKLNSAPDSMKDKKNAMEVDKKDVGKKNASDSLNKKEAKKGNPKGVKMMPVKPKKAKGIKDAFKTPGKETKKKIDEGLDIGSSKLKSQYINVKQFLSILKAVHDKNMPALEKALIDTAARTAISDDRIPFEPIKQVLSVNSTTIGDLLPHLNETENNSNLINESISFLNEIWNSKKRNNDTLM